jgi:hypothetical protein
MRFALRTNRARKVSYALLSGALITLAALRWWSLRKKVFGRCASLHRVR